LKKHDRSGILTDKKADVQGVSISGNALQNYDYGYNHKAVLALSFY